MKPFPWWVRLLRYPLTASDDVHRVRRSRYCWRADQGMFVLSLIGVVNGLMPAGWYVGLYQRAGQPWRVAVWPRTRIADARLRARLRP